MNKILALYYLLFLLSMYENIQAAARPQFQNASTPSVPPIFPNTQPAPEPTNPPASTPTPKTLPAPNLATPATPTSPIPIVNPPTPPTTPTSPTQKTIAQTEAEIRKQIKDGKAPAKINSYGAPQTTINNSTQAPLYIGFEGGITLSKIEQNDHIDLPVGQNYIVYATNNPTGNALHLSYQSNSAQQNKVRNCKAKNGTPSFDKNDPQSFTGNAYIALDANKNLILSSTN